MTNAASPSNDPSSEAGLSYVSDQDPGIRRRGAGRGFAYYDDENRLIRDPGVLARIKSLAIPPAWTEVWICPEPAGHIQATGRDARGRKQYRYHPRWRRFRDRNKYGRVLAFGRALPRLRAKIDADLRRHGLVRERVLAAVTRLLEVTLIRVGNEDYARTNHSYGLTTLRKRHAILGRTGAVFEFRGKSGVKHRTGFRDARLARIVRACQELPGQRLFQYVDENGLRHAIGSAEVNAYMHEAMGEDFSAKDFRTWAGALAAYRFLRDQPAPANAAEARSVIGECVKDVARQLGNTAAVCRACYIHPRVLSAYEEGALRAAGSDDEHGLIRLLARAGQP